jgi:glycosyltransferase involved in cell wall biosynthesis
MRILICLHHLVLGGDTINALELGCRLRDRGHTVSFLAIADQSVREHGAPLLSLAEGRRAPVQVFDEPSGIAGRARLIAQIAAFVRAEAFDVVHAFGHRDTYYTFCAAYGIAGVPLVINDYAMTVTRGLPRRPPLVVGTREVYDEALAVRSGETHVVEPPVDERENAPDAVDGARFREDHAIEEADVLVAVVSRFSNFLKREGLLAAIDAIRMLDDPTVRLMLVGDGEARDEVRSRADGANEQLGRDAVLLPGPLLDPRPAYAAADIVLGMGHSALRGMAFGKPVVVVGERGFSLPVSPASFDHFAYHGFYGLGDGGDAAPRLATQLDPLVRGPALRRDLGAFGRRTVEQLYGLEAAASRMEDIYRQAGARRSWIRWISDAGYLGTHYSTAKLRRLAQAR